MRRKLGAPPHFGGGELSWVSIKHNVARAEAYKHAKFHLNPCNHLATIHQRHRQTDRTDRQWSDSIGRTVLQTVAQNRFALRYRTVVLSCLSVTLLCCCQAVH